jgi:type I restriction enzyme M protein
MSISTTIKAIQDIMRKDAGVDGDAQRISQLGWMFFLKIFDDRELERQLMLELDGKPYQSPIPEELRWTNWAADEEGITGETLLNFINNELFPTLKELDISDADPKRRVVRNVFEDAYNYMKNGTLLRQVINKLNEIDFNKRADQHLFGDIYEQILKDLQSAGNAGEFYTPRAVTSFMVDRLAPKLGEKLLDPACGTGGFLTHSIDYLVEHNPNVSDFWQIVHDTLTGVEKKQLPHLLATTNMMLHGLDVPDNIRHDNTLSRPLRDYTPADRVDIILTNPPFGGNEEDGIEKNFPANFQTRETADLFMALIIHLLKDGGRAAVVLPDGFLFGEGVKTRVKEKLLDECNLHTIVRLPNGVFNPYTGIKTNLLFFSKGEPTTDIWYFEHPYPPGYKSYSKTKPIRIEEFKLEQNWWDNRTESELAWKVSAESIRAQNYNLDQKNPNTPEDDLGDPDELLAKYQKLQAQVERTQNELLNELKAALRHNQPSPVILNEA